MKLKIILFLALVGLLLGAKFIFFPSLSTGKETKGVANTGVPLTNVGAIILKSEKITNNVYASGTILAKEEVQLQTEIAGKIITLNFKEGSAVRKGQLLVKLNDAELQANYRKLKIQNTLADEKMKRQEKLLAVNGISQEEFDISSSQLNVLKAEMEFAIAEIDKTEIRAPFSGIVGLKNISVGATITPSTVIATLLQMDSVKIDFFVSEKYATTVKKGDPISFMLDGSKEEIKGQVYAIEPSIDKATRTLQVRAICANKKGDFFPGAFAKVQLDLGFIDNALMVPTEAIIPDLKGKKVYRIKNGAAEFVSVEAGLRTESKILIVAGLSQGDTIITKGMMQLRPGSKVTITELK